MKGPIQSVEVTYLVHATEDEAKLSGAVGRLLAVESAPESEELEGHFGNRIVRVRYHLTGEQANEAVASLKSRIPQRLKEELRGRVDEMLDEHSTLYLRLDKQRMVEGKVEEGSGDSVRVRLKPRAFLMRGSARDFYVGLLFGGA